MIRPEHKPVIGQLRKSFCDIAGSELRAIAADQNHLVIAELRDGLDRVLEPLRKRGAGLRMNIFSTNEIPRSENVNVRSRRGFPQRQIKERAQT